MSGNSFGKLFTITTAGESHGESLVGIVDGALLEWIFAKLIYKAI